MDDHDINLDQILAALDQRLTGMTSPDFSTSLGCAATITTAASGNSWPYVTTNSGTYTLTNGTGSINPSLTFNDYWDNTGNKAGLHVKGNAEFEGDIKLKGKSLNETLDKIEQRLAILHPNTHLESKWEELKKLGEAYRALEKDILEKEKIWETLKK